MTKKRKYPPALYRYIEKNPAIAFRLPKVEYEKLRELIKMSNKSIRDLVREYILETAKKKEDLSYRSGYVKGYEKGRKDWQIWYYCCICNEKLIMRPNEDDHKQMIEYMREHRWGHSECHKKYKR